MYVFRLRESQNPRQIYYRRLYVQPLHFTRFLFIDDDRLAIWIGICRSSDVDPQCCWRWNYKQAPSSCECFSVESKKSSAFRHLPAFPSLRCTRSLTFLFSAEPTSTNRHYTNSAPLRSQILLPGLADMTIVKPCLASRLMAGASSSNCTMQIPIFAIPTSTPTVVILRVILTLMEK
jgi:hypothetical protein